MFYNLEINFDSKDVRSLLENNYQVVLVKDVQSPGNSQAVAWAVLRPMNNNQISWEDNFAAFASNSEPMPGVVITTKSQALLSFSETIAYRSQSFETAKKTASIKPGSMAIVNQDDNINSLTSGLSLPVNANGRAMPATPICVTKIAKNQQTTFSPSEGIKVFLAPNISPGSVVGNIPFNAYSVAMGQGKNSATIRYDANSQSFVA